MTEADKTIVTLANGVEMPVLALGAAPLMTNEEDSSAFHPLNAFNGFLPEQICRSAHELLEMKAEAIKSSSDRGKPVHIDTALVYRTHPHIRQALFNALATGKIERSDVFLTTKVFHPSYSFGPEDLGQSMPFDAETMAYDDVYKFVYKQFQQSLHECGVGYFDLVLLHWPGRNHPKADAIGNSERRLAAWNVLEDCYAKGWTRSIGVSNFSERHLEQLQMMNSRGGLKNPSKPLVKPHVNQIEASVFLQHKGILKYCRENDIVPMAYSPLGRGCTHVTKDETVLKLAAKYKKDAGQVAMKYLLQKGYKSVVFWTTNVQRIRSNHDIHDFELEQSELEALDALNRSDGSGTWGLTSPYDIP